MARKKFQDLDLANAFLFAATLSNPEICRLVLQILLGRTIGSFTVNAEHSMLFSTDCRSIRLDIYADDEDGNHYNVEMQGENDKISMLFGKAFLQEMYRKYQIKFEIPVCLKKCSLS